MAKIPEGASRIRNIQGAVIGYTLKGKKYYFDKDKRPVEPTGTRNLVYSRDEKDKNPIKRDHGGSGADWSKLMKKKSTSADEKPPEEKKTEPDKKPETEVRTATNTNRGGGGGNRNGSSGGSSGGSNTTSTPPRRKPLGGSRTAGPLRDGNKYGRLLRSEKTARENERVRGETKEELKKQGMSDRMAKALSNIKKWEPDKKKK